MTEFERLCDALNVPIELDDHGLYKGMTRALAVICCDVIMGGMTERDVEREVKKRFYEKFPYMR